MKIRKIAQPTRPSLLPEVSPQTEGAVNQTITNVGLTKDQVVKLLSGLGMAMGKSDLSMTLSEAQQIIEIIDQKENPPVYTANDKAGTSCTTKFKSSWVPVTVVKSIASAPVGPVAPVSPEMALIAAP